MAMNQSDYLTQQELEQILGKAEGYLRYRRRAGLSVPQSIRLGRRSRIYPVAHVERWLADLELESGKATGKRPHRLAESVLLAA
jgi:predicted DNA-binding transcriptional regulator AlpA